MQGSKDYLKEIQKFTTSHYWNSGVRITAGVVVPMLVMVSMGWLSKGIPFLFGALFVSLTDAPGPIHHRRNGMFVAIVLNTFTVLITSLLPGNHILQVFQVALFSFFFSMLGIYGARAGAIGTLALVIMLIHMSPLRGDGNVMMSVMLTAGGGMWYAVFSLLLNRLQPYRLVEQAQGENLILIAQYIRTRAAFFKEGANINEVFDRVMKDQVDVLRTQNSLRELLFKTRQLVGDASPKSRSMMMIFLESLDLFEEAMYSYQDYKLLHEQGDANLLNKLYRTAIQVSAELEYIGLSVQTGTPVKKMPDLSLALDEFDEELEKFKTASSPLPNENLFAIRQTSKNIRSIVARLSKIVSYTRLEEFDPNRFPDHEIEMPARSPRITLSLLRENLTLRSSNFRFAIRITTALLIGYAVSALFALSHAYWVMLTTLTILKPVYHLTRARNIQRVLGTLGGVVLAISIVYFISNTAALFVIMIFSMLMAYSLLRVNYFGFVTFLTLYVVITFHFLNPVTFRSLIGERLIDTLVGSLIAAFAARFIFPVWQHYQIQSVMKKSLVANTAYFLSAWNMKRDPSHTRQYNAARNEAIVTLTNLSDSFQKMLSEPGTAVQATQVHQFVITSHLLTSRISSLSEKDLRETNESKQLVTKITDNLQYAAANIESRQPNAKETISPATLPLPALHPLSIIHSLSRDIRAITSNRGQ